MHTTTQFSAVQNTSTQDAPVSSTPSSSVRDTSKMTHKAQHAVINTTASSPTTPTSARSSISNLSSVSSLSSRSIPKRSSMKSSLQSRQSTVSIKSAPPTVRFAEPELPLRPKPAPLQRQRQVRNPQRNSVQNASTRLHRTPSTMISSLASLRYSAGSQPNSTLPPQGVPTPQLGQINFSKPRISQRHSAPVQPLRPDLGQSRAKVTENFTPPSLTLERRVSSLLSVSSTFSVQSAPAVLQNVPSTCPPGQYNPLEHYIPCLDAECTTRYSVAVLGPAHYLPQGSYLITKLHGYCPNHAVKEFKEANAWCKRKWESLRQNAGRKTLGQIALEFDIFLDIFRHERKTEDADLQQRLKHLVLGPSSPSQSKGKQPVDTQWLWQFTPRHCTRASCASLPYSPFANHLFSFYNTSSTSSFTPLPTLCPSCAKNEVEAFERMFIEKWNSRCGWHEHEWDEWVKKVVLERHEEKTFWEKAQEREVRDRGSARLVEDKEIVDVVGVKAEEHQQVEKRKSVFKRMFGRK